MTNLSKREIILAGAAAAAIGATVPPASAAAADPIFAAIERHRAAVLESDRLCEIVEDVFHSTLSEYEEGAAYEEWAAVRRVEERQRLQDPHTAAAVAALAAADVEQDLARRALASVGATTGAGVLALVRYAIEVIEPCETHPDDSLAMRILPAIERSLAALAGARPDDRGGDQ